MGAKSTIDISKTKALDFIQENLHQIDNKTLANLVEEINDYFIEKKDYEHSLGLHNFQIND